MCPTLPISETHGAARAACAAGSVSGVCVQPIGEAERRQVTAETAAWLRRAADIYGRDFPLPAVLFDLRGRMAGMYRVVGVERAIRYNPWLFAKYPVDGMAITVPHEVAHYVTDLLYGFDHIRPHGREWQEVMRAFGLDPRAAIHHSLDLTGIPQRRQRRHAYRCACRGHELSTVRHARIQRRTVQYYCRRCGSELVAEAAA